MGEELLGKTMSLCPVCLQRLSAQKVRVGGEVYLRKTCPQHGSFSTVIWRGEPDYLSWMRPKVSHSHPYVQAQSVRGCPFDCGLCPQHQQEGCCVLLEVTSRCNQHCPVCYARSGAPGEDIPVDTIHKWLETLVEAGGGFNIQFSGGEPTLRDDLPELIRLARNMGFGYIQLNTNGLRLAADHSFARQLKEAGLAVVFLQFDGTRDEIYRQLRGQALLEYKQKAIACCRELGLGVVLVPTLVPGINQDNIGEIIDFALQGGPGIRGVHFQPVAYLGRYSQAPDNHNRITLPEVMRAIVEQSQGRIQLADLLPGGCEHSHCSFHGDFVCLEDGSLKALSSRQRSCCSSADRSSAEEKKRDYVSRRWGGQYQSCTVSKGQTIKLGEWEDFLVRVQTHSFSISAMAFQDVWNLDLERLQHCSLQVMSPTGKKVPFCAYNLTSSKGESLYRK